MTEHRTGSRAEWQAARDELLALEKELTRRNDELAEQRRSLPWVPVEKDYTFATDDGAEVARASSSTAAPSCSSTTSCSAPKYEAGCARCSSIADSINGSIPHLNARDVTMLCVSRAPLEKLQAYKRRMGWRFGWVSTYDSDFSRDFGFSLHRRRGAGAPRRRGSARSSPRRRRCAAPTRRAMSASVPGS